MKTWLLNRWNALRSSYWFLPAALALVALALSQLTLELDERWAGSALSWAYPGGPAGARAVLTTIGSSVIGLAGVVFSITVVALTMASAQLGPRLLRTFLRDRGNQLVLGGFIATFLFCLLSLRAVGRDVPAASVTVAVGLAIADVGLLIYFIHSATASLQADQVVAGIARDLLAAMDRLAHADSADAPDERSQEAWVPGAAQRAVSSQASGYVQVVDYAGLFRIACEEDTVIRALRRPGQFVVAGAELATLAEARPEVEQAVRACFLIGRIRTEEQDVEYAINQLVEVALRALSPGINDPFTAIACVDWLGAALSRALERGLPSRVRRDPEGRARLFKNEPDFGGLTSCAFDQVRQASRETPALRLRLLETLASMARLASTQEERAVLREHADLIRSEEASATLAPADLASISDRYDAFEGELRRSAQAASGQDWAP